MAIRGKIITCCSMHLNTCVIMHTQAYLYLCALANACMPTHMPACIHTLIYIKCKYVRLNMHTKEMYLVRKSRFVHDPVERLVFHWLSYIIRLAMGLIIPFVHSMINEFCCPCINLGVFILRQKCEFLHVAKGSKIRCCIKYAIGTKAHISH